MLIITRLLDKTRGKIKIISLAPVEPGWGEMHIIQELMKQWERREEKRRPIHYLKV